MPHMIMEEQVTRVQMREEKKDSACRFPCLPQFIHVILDSIPECGSERHSLRTKRKADRDGREGRFPLPPPSSLPILFLKPSTLLSPFSALSQSVGRREADLLLHEEDVGHVEVPAGCVDVLGANLQTRIINLSKKKQQRKRIERKRWQKGEERERNSLEMRE